MISIAIDGPGGAGKSTLARQLAVKLKFIYIDTGAIYRTAGLAAVRAGIRPADEVAVAALLPRLKIGIEYCNGEQVVTLNGENVNAFIRTPEASKAAADVSALPCVRDYLLQVQRELADERDVVMDGRDIGTIVLPNADVKIFLTADIEERARRRYEQLKDTDVTFEAVLEAIALRDEKDIKRAIAPLKAADDAVVVNTTEMTLAESLDKLMQIVRKKLQESGGV
ncbi:MAG: (d)CMP kinase [Oscillospiraceae bacterium]|nr:(d)CMP kinase [Oscillospiraceae bacterium]